MIPLIFIWFFVIICIEASQRWSDQLDHDSNVTTPPLSQLETIKTMTAQIACLKTENDALRHQINFERDQMADERRFYWEDRSKMQKAIHSANQELQEMKSMHKQGEISVCQFHESPPSPPSPPPYPDSTPSDSLFVVQSVPFQCESSELENPVMGIPLTQIMEETKYPKRKPKIDRVLYKTQFCHAFMRGKPPRCRFGNNCAFAHGRQELRAVD